MDELWRKNSLLSRTYNWICWKCSPVWTVSMEQETELISYQTGSAVSLFSYKWVGRINDLFLLAYAAQTDNIHRKSHILFQILIICGKFLGGNFSCSDNLYSCMCNATSGTYLHSRKITSLNPRGLQRSTPIQNGYAFTYSGTIIQSYNYIPWYEDAKIFIALKFH